MAYERCADCDHTWHGTACKAIDAELRAPMLYVQTKCKCPSSWRDPNDDTREPRHTDGLAR